MDFLGFNIVRRGQQFLAYRMSLGDLKPDDFGLEWWLKQARAGNCLFAENPYDLKSMIVRRCLSEAARPGSEFARLRQVELQLEQLSGRQAGMHSVLGDVLQRLENLGDLLEIKRRPKAWMSSSWLRVLGRIPERLPRMRSGATRIADSVGKLFFRLPAERTPPQIRR
jgi:hypothetical protein